jgi:protoporphyrinogen oxidase
MSSSPASYYDVIIIGSGMAGLYAALQVKKLAPKLSFLVVEKYDTYGGKSYNEDFENTSVVTGALESVDKTLTKKWLESWD